MSIPLLNTLIQPLRPISSISTTLHEQLSYHLIKRTLSVKYHSWRFGLCNMGGFGGSWTHATTSHCCACNTQHHCDIDGALVQCGHATTPLSGLLLPHR